MEYGKHDEHRGEVFFFSLVTVWDLILLEVLYPMH